MKNVPSALEIAGIVVALIGAGLIYWPLSLMLLGVVMVMAGLSIERASRSSE